MAYVASEIHVSGGKRRLTKGNTKRKKQATLEEERNGDSGEEGGDGVEEGRDGGGQLPLGAGRGGDGVEEGGDGGGQLPLGVGRGGDGAGQGRDGKGMVKAGGSIKKRKRSSSSTMSDWLVLDDDDEDCIDEDRSGEQASKKSKKVSARMSSTKGEGVFLLSHETFSNASPNLQQFSGAMDSFVKLSRSINKVINQSEEMVTDLSDKLQEFLAVIAACRGDGAGGIPRELSLFTLLRSSCKYLYCALLRRIIEP